MKPTPQPQKKPEAAPTPKPPPVTSLCLGKTTSGLHCVALVMLQPKDDGRRPDATSFSVVSSAVLFTSRDLLAVEEAWDDMDYPMLYHGESRPEQKAHLFASGRGVALVSVPKTLRSIRTGIAFEVAGGRMTEFQVIHEGGKLDAWQELHDWASRHLLTESAATRRKRQG